MAPLLQARVVDPLDSFAPPVPRKRVLSSTYLEWAARHWGGHLLGAWLDYRCDSCPKRNRGQERCIPKDWLKMPGQFKAERRGQTVTVRMPGLICAECATKWLAAHHELGSSWAPPEPPSAPPLGPRHHEFSCCRVCGVFARNERRSGHPLNWERVYEPGGGYRCRECGITSRSRSRKQITEVAPGIETTRSVAERLRRVAASEVREAPELGQAAAISSVIVWVAIVAFFASMGLVLSGMIVPALGALGLMALLLFVVEPLIRRELIEPLRVEHEVSVGARQVVLATARKAAIAESQRFYSSAEWLAVRRSTIERLGRACASCKKVIEDDWELSVDHIRPRSRYPDLALDQANLQILCRSCNSRKGARET